MTQLTLVHSVTKACKTMVTFSFSQWLKSQGAQDKARKVSSFMWVVIFYMGYFTPSRPRILRSIVSQKPVLSVIQHCWWKEKQIFFHYYLRQVNRVNSGITVFVQRVSVCVLVHSGPVNQTSLKRLELRASNLARMLPETVQK